MCVLVVVCCSLIGWLCLYQLCVCVCASRGPEWNCRLVTLTHGVVIVILTAYVIFIDGPWPLTHAGTENTFLQTVSLSVCLGYFLFDMLVSCTENTFLQTVSLSVCLGYFLFDMLWCVLNRSEGPVMLAHHAASILGILLALATGASACETCAVIFGSEITNPLLQTRWFLRKIGLYDSLLGDFVDLSFIFLFATVRVGVGTAMFYCELMSTKPILLVKLGGVVMYVLAWVFMVDIAKFGYKKSKGKYKKWQEKKYKCEEDVKTEEEEEELLKKKTDT